MGNNIVKNNIHLNKNPLYVISQGRFSLFYSYTNPFDYSLSILHNTAKIKLDWVLLFAHSPPATKTNCSML